MGSYLSIFSSKMIKFVFQRVYFFISIEDGLERDDESEEREISYMIIIV